MAVEEEMAAARWKSVQMKRVLDVSFSDTFFSRRSRVSVRRTILLVFLVLSILL